MTEFDSTEFLLRRAFTPASPISHAHRLQGRSGLLVNLRRAWSREGASVALYGRRGAGKTSLVKVAAVQFRGRVFYHSASGDDTFASIALAMFHHFGPTDGSPTPTLAAEPALTPQNVVQFLPRTPTLLIIDDLERIECRDTSFAFADLAKKISDAAIPATLTFVGVGDHVGELIEGHKSVARQLIVLEVHPLTRPSIENIVRVGAKMLGIQFDRDAMDEITRLSENMPYHAHLLCECAVHCLLNSIRGGERSERVVLPRDVSAGVEYARTIGQFPAPPDNAQTWFQAKRRRTGS